MPPKSRKRKAPSEDPPPAEPPAKAKLTKEEKRRKLAEQKARADAWAAQREKRQAAKAAKEAAAAGGGQEKAGTEDAKMEAETEARAPAKSPAGASAKTPGRSRSAAKAATPARTPARSSRRSLASAAKKPPPSDSESSSAASEGAPSPPKPTPKRRKLVSAPAAAAAAPAASADAAAGSAKKSSKEEKRRKLAEQMARADAWAAQRRGASPKKASSPKRPASAAQVKAESSVQAPAAPAGIPDPAMNPPQPQPQQPMIPAPADSPRHPPPAPPAPVVRVPLPARSPVAVPDRPPSPALTPSQQLQPAALPPVPPPPQPRTYYVPKPAARAPAAHRPAMEEEAVHVPPPAAFPPPAPSGYIDAYTPAPPAAPAAAPVSIAPAPAATEPATAPSASSQFRANAAAAEAGEKEEKRRMLAEQRARADAWAEERRRFEIEAGIAAVCEPFREDIAVPADRAAETRATQDLDDALYDSDGELEVEGAEVGIRARVGALLGRTARFVRCLGSMLWKLAKYATFGAALAGIFALTYHSLMKADWFNSSTTIGNETIARSTDAVDVIAAPPCFVDRPLPTPEQLGERERLDDASRAELEETMSRPPSAAAAAGIARCANPDSPEPCPERGVCWGGYLRECAELPSSAEHPDLFATSETFDKCVPSPHAQEVMERVQTALVELTVERTCGILCQLSRGYMCTVPNNKVITTTSEGGDKGWMFQVDPLVNYIATSMAVPVAKPTEEAEGGDSSWQRPIVTAAIVSVLAPYMDPEVVKYEGTVDHGQEMTSHEPLMGLTPTYIRKSLPIPFHCWACILVSQLFGFLFATFIYLMKAYPLSAFIAFLLVCIARRFRLRKHCRALIQARVHSMRELAYDRLVECDDGEGYAALHLRDHLTHELHPTKHRERKFLSEVVWPCVVAEVRRDNRVRKSTREVGGKRLEWWEWISQAAKKSRRSRGALSPAPVSVSSKKDN